MNKGPNCDQLGPELQFTMARTAINMFPYAGAAVVSGLGRVQQAGISLIRARTKICYGPNNNLLGPEPQLTRARSTMNKGPNCDQLGPEQEFTRARIAIEMFPDAGAAVVCGLGRVWQSVRA